MGITYKEFKSSEHYVDSLDCVMDTDDGLAGYIYLREGDDCGFYLIALEGSNGPEYIVPIGNGEFIFHDLEQASAFLWDEFAVYECNHQEL